MPRRKQKLGNATNVEDSNGVERTPLRRSRRNPVNENCKDHKHVLNILMVEGSNGVDEPLLRRSRLKHVNETGKNQHSKVDQEFLMSKEDCIIKTPTVLIQKLNIEHIISSPGFEQSSPNSLDSGISSEISSLKDESFSVSAVSTPLRRSKRKPVNEESKVEMPKNDQTISMFKQDHMIKTLRVLIKKLKTEDKTSSPQLEQSSPDSADSGISSEISSLKDESFSLSAVSIPLRRSKRKPVNEKSEDKIIKNDQAISMFKQDHMIKTPKVFIKKFKTEDKTYSLHLEQSSGLNLKDENCPLSTVSKQPTKTEFFSLEKSFNTSSVIEGYSAHSDVQVKESSKKRKFQSNGKRKLDDIFKASISSHENKRHVSKNTNTINNQSTIFQNEKESELLLEPTNKKDLFLLEQNNNTAFVEGNAANSSSNGEETVLQVLTRYEFDDHSDGKSSCSKQLKTESCYNDSSSESDWEEVEERNELSLEDYNPIIPNDGVEITIDCPELNNKYKRKRKQRQFDHIRLCINRELKRHQLNIHKTHLLCLLAHGLFVNDILISLNLKALALSYLPSDILAVTAGKKIDKANSNIILKLVSWFCETFSFENKQLPFIGFHKGLTNYFQEQKSLSPSEYNLMFIVFARTLGFKTRFCISFYPVSYKTKNLLKTPSSKKKDSCQNVLKKPGSKKKDSCQNLLKKLGSKKKDSCQSECNSEEECNLKHEKSASVAQKSSKKNSVIAAKKKNTKHNFTVKKQKPSRPQRQGTRKSYKMNYDYDEDEIEDEDEIDDEDFVGDETDDEDEIDDEDFVEDEIDDEDFVEDEDFVNEPSKKIKQVKRAYKNLSKKSSIRKVASSDSVPDSPENCNFEVDKIICWCEVFSKPDKQWISIECTKKIIDRPYYIEKLLPQPITYIVAYDNDSYIKDVTKRYCNEYMTSTLKLRADSKWWEETLKCFAPPNSKINKEEEEKLDELLVNKPLPKTIGEYKNHPLYALKRHFLKFEALYPPNAAPVGFIREEPIYLRDNVCILHTREDWVKEARAVRIGEEAYKFVKARPKWDRINRRIATDLPPVEVFGFWQTVPYEPPVAVGGKVPRNEYGNVELFKPWMLPQGTVHLQIPGLNRVAKKLDIDCSPAFMGFDQTKGTFCPLFDGFVVCEEFKDTLLAAWEDEQVHVKKREEEKRKKRIYGNWRKLIKGLLIRERIKVKYDVK